MIFLYFFFSKRLWDHFCLFIWREVCVYAGVCCLPFLRFVDKIHIFRNCFLVFHFLLAIFIFCFKIECQLYSHIWKHRIDFIDLFYVLHAANNSISLVLVTAFETVLCIKISITRRKNRNIFWVNFLVGVYDTSGHIISSKAFFCVHQKLKGKKGKTKYE